MVMQLGFLRDALIEAGASEAKAGKAAEELAAYENQFAAISSDIIGLKTDLAAFRAEVKADLAAFRGEIKAEFAAFRGETKAEFAAVRGETNAGFASIRGEINLLKWMLGALLGVNLAVALKLFLH